MAERFVLDASVAAKWFLKDEPDVDLAEELLNRILTGDLEAHVPHLFLYEVPGLLAQACGSRNPETRQPRFTKSQALDALADFFGVSLSVHQVDVHGASRALELAVDCSKRFKDMSYVNLAVSLDCEWCTADEKVLRGDAPIFPSDRVVLLSSLRETGTAMGKG